MKKKKLNFKLSEDEQKLESEIENGEWKPVSKKNANRPLKAWEKFNE